MPDCSANFHQIRAVADLFIYVVLITTMEMGPGNQFALRTVAPGVIGTDKGFAIRSLLCNKLCAPMTTYIVECPDDIVIATGGFYFLNKRYGL